jgi:peptidyl-prolyl cis-trans isomerase B (cyclophilin B)
MMRRLVLAILLVAMPAAAQQPNTSDEKLAAARELVTAMRAESQMNATIDALRGYLVQSFVTAAPRLGEAKVRELVDEFIMPEFRASTGEFREIFAGLYAQRLTVAEMRELARVEIGLVGVGIGPFVQRREFGHQRPDRLELDDEKAPASVGNFLDYVRAGHYDGTVFHRVIKGFMVQGGGMDASMQQKSTRAPITNEAGNGLRNAKYTVAMARTSDPHSATAQFFINTSDNAFLNFTAETRQGWGYAVFGKVVAGTDVVDAIEFGWWEDMSARSMRLGIRPRVVGDAWLDAWRTAREELGLARTDLS